MITVWGGQTSRSMRVIWVLEEMSLSSCAAGRHARCRAGPGFSCGQPRQLHPGNPGWRRRHGRVDRDYGISDGPLWADVAGARAARSDLPRLSAVPASGRGRARDADDARYRQPLHRAGDRAGELGRALVPTVVSESAEARQPTPCPLALSCGARHSRLLISQ